MNEIYKKELAVVRELAKKYAEYAALPVMEERRLQWYRHNACSGEKPMVVMELGTFQSDMISLECTDPFLRGLEHYFKSSVVNHEEIDDDKVIAPYYASPRSVWFTDVCAGVRSHTTDETRATGHSFAQEYDHPIHDLEAQFDEIPDFKYFHDPDKTERDANRAREAIGDILPVAVKNTANAWPFSISNRFIPLMGLERMMISMYDCPDAVRALYDKIVDGILGFFEYQQKDSLLELNNGNDYVGAGSYAFTHELPAPEFDGNVRLCDMWTHFNSQETVSVSPEMFGELVFPSYDRAARLFGLVYYGCCEPVHLIWDFLTTWKNLRKVSISKWCDERFMGDALRGTKTIYSRKPSPLYVGADRVFDESAFSAHIKESLDASRGCKSEFIFRDIYSVCGERTRPGRAVALTRQAIENYYKG